MRGAAAKRSLSFFNKDSHNILDSVFLRTYLIHYLGPAGLLFPYFQLRRDFKTIFKGLDGIDPPTRV